jgi:hypothetical protein
MKTLRLLLSGLALLAGLGLHAQTQYPAAGTISAGDKFRVLQQSGDNYVTRDAVASTLSMDLADLSGTATTPVDWAREKSFSQAWQFGVAAIESGEYFNSWANFGSGERAFTIRADAPGRSSFVGVIKKTGTASAFEVMARVPDLFKVDYNQVAPTFFGGFTAGTVAGIYFTAGTREVKFAANQSSTISYMDLLGAFETPAVMWTVTNTVSGDPAIFSVPVNCPSNNPTVVVYLHGAWGYAQSQENPWVLGSYTNTVRALATNGWIVAAPYMKGDAWGNSTNTAAVSNFVAFCTNQFRSTNVYVIGESMGGPPALKILTTSPVVSKFYGISPVCALSNMWRHATFTNAVTGSYGITDAASFVTLTAGYDPAGFSSGAFAGKHLKIAASPADTSVDKTLNADALSNRVASASAYFAITNVAGAAHGASALIIPADIVDFFQNH